MFNNDDKQETVNRLIAHARAYGEKRIERLERNTAEKMSTLLCAVIIGAIGIIIGGIIIVLLSIAAVIALAPYVGGIAQACLFMALAYTVLILILYLGRGTLFRSPIHKSLTRLFLKEKADKPAPSSSEIERARLAVLRDYEDLTTTKRPRTKKERFLESIKKAWTMAEYGFLGYKLYRQYKNQKNRRR